MSCDYAVWYPHTRLSDAQASELYKQLCAGITGGVQAHPAVDAFYAELTARYPPIDDTSKADADHEYLCPWSGPFIKSGGHVIMSCLWPRAEYMGTLITSLAAKHGLALYDPQTLRIKYPLKAATRKSWWKFWS
jgi:hypothetical protein